MNYYNEFDPNAASWLRELIAQKLIPIGEIDVRSIADVSHTDLKGFNQCHFFAGIGGWSYALKIGGIPDDYPMWTGSCPCQPFSTAGNRKGKHDERHLWPVFFELIRQCRPPIVLGEQVAAAIAHGWLDDLCDDLEGEGYETRAQVLPACSIGTPHKRDRLYWLAHSKSQRIGRGRTEGLGSARTAAGERKYSNGEPVKSVTGSATGGVADTNKCHAIESNRCVDGSENGETLGNRENFAVAWKSGRASADVLCLCYTEYDGQSSDTFGRSFEQIETKSGMLEFEGSNTEWVLCRDEKYRPIKSGIEPLVNGIPRGMVYGSDSSISPSSTQEARIIRLKGYGNAIVPQVAAAFIESNLKRVYEHS